MVSDRAANPRMSFAMSDTSEIVKTKRCNGCEQVLPINRFRLRRPDREWRNSKCKTCMSRRKYQRQREKAQEAKREGQQRARSVKSPHNFKERPRELDAARAVGHARLLAAVRRELAAGLRVPCIENPSGGWTSGDPDETLRAAELCGSCPALAACRSYIEAHPEPAGVWAGLTANARHPREGNQL